MFVIRRNNDGMFVSKPGSEKSYTANILKARIFKTKDQATDNKCTNEYVEDVSNILQEEE